MIRQDHLEVYDLTLTARSPIYVGSGTEYKAIDYLFDAETRRVSILNQEALFQLLMDKGLVEQYEAFALSGRKNLRTFLQQECRLNQEELRRVTRYSVSASNALDAQHSLKEIHAFQRRADGRAYVPGSGVKGALRTAFLTSMLLNPEERKRASLTLYHSWEDRKGYRMATEEGKYLNTLHLKKDRRTQVWGNDPVNSLFRGISISDSEPIPDSAMILCGKFDADINGGIGQLNLCRECVRPGTAIHCRLTLDQSILKGSVTRESLLERINAFDRYYRETYLPHFKAPAGAVAESYQKCLILGGGAGFLAKTVVYPAYGYDEGLKFAADELNAQFRKHRHDLDPEDEGISPRMMKYARFGGKYYHYGICGVTLQ